MLEKQTVAEVHNSYGRCLLNDAFLDRFYDVFMDSHEAIRPMFAKTDFDAQKQLLRHGLGMVLQFAADNTNAMAAHALKRIRTSHSKEQLDILPDLYTYWMDSIVQAVSECDTEYQPALEGAWRQVLTPGVEFIRAGYGE